MRLSTSKAQAPDGDLKGTARPRSLGDSVLKWAARDLSWYKENNDFASAASLWFSFDRRGEKLVRLEILKEIRERWTVEVELVALKRSANRRIAFGAFLCTVGMGVIGYFAEYANTIPMWLQQGLVGETVAYAPLGLTLIGFLSATSGGGTRMTAWLLRESNEEVAKQEPQVQTQKPFAIPARVVQPFYIGPVGTDLTDK